MLTEISDNADGTDLYCGCGHGSKFNHVTETCVCGKNMIRKIDDFKSSCECLEGWEYVGNKLYSQGECVDTMCGGDETQTYVAGSGCVCAEDYWWNEEAY